MVMENLLVVQFTEGWDIIHVYCFSMIVDDGGDVGDMVTMRLMLVLVSTKMKMVVVLEIAKMKIMVKLVALTMKIC